MREDYERYRDTMRVVLDVLERCFEKPNCMCHFLSNTIDIMYHHYEREQDVFYITVKGVDFEFVDFNNVVNFLVAYIGG